MSRPDELQVSVFLAKRLTKVMGEEHIARSESEEDNDADTYITDSMGQEVKIQNVTSEGEVLRNAIENGREFERGGHFRAHQVDHGSWVQGVIDKKEARGYTDPISMVLAIKGSMPTPSPETILEMRQVESSFGGIYYVSTPTSSADSGYVVALKKYWQTPDIF